MHAYKQNFRQERSHLKIAEPRSPERREQVLQWVALLESEDNWAEALREFTQLPLDFKCEVWDIIAQKL